MMMQKLLLFSVNHVDTEGQAVADVAHAVQTQMLLRLMVGLLNEAWNVVTTRFNQNKFNVEYRALLDDGGLAALGELNKQFGDTNVLSKIRNNYAFHHPSSEEVEAAFKAACENGDIDASYWAYYFAQSGLNSVFLISDLVMVHGIMAAIGEDGWDAGQAKLMKQVLSATHNIVEFSKSFVVAVWRKHFGEEMISDDITEITGAPDIAQFSLPFFVTIPGEKPIAKDAVFAVRPKPLDQAVAAPGKLDQNAGQNVDSAPGATKS